jgi:hypothetical protein
LGVGVGDRGVNIAKLTTPLPNPPPQEGREQTELSPHALVPIWLPR